MPEQDQPVQNQPEQQPQRAAIRRSRPCSIRPVIITVYFLLLVADAILYKLLIYDAKKKIDAREIDARIRGVWVSEDFFLHQKEKIENYSLMLAVYTIIQMLTLTFLLVCGLSSGNNAGCNFGLGLSQFFSIVRTGHGLNYTPVNDVEPELATAVASPTEETSISESDTGLSV